MTELPDRMVAVFGSSDPRDGEAEYELARTVGRKLAELGCTVVNGGYGGTMEASARGAKEAGGTTVGVTCSIWRGRANRYIDRCVQTADLWERVATLLKMGTAGCVALPGATGTLLELAAAWELTCKRLCPRRPVVCVGAFWRPLVATMAAARPGCEAFVSVIDEAAELERFFASPKVE
jgi:uncharacterized protein (TIGR00725 family)